jgi:hypothetical protein
MPWTYIDGSREQLLGILTNDQKFRTPNLYEVERNLIDSKFVNGSDLWTVWENRINGVEQAPTIRFDRVDYNEELKMWGHNQIREGDGRLLPNTCPTEFLALAPNVPNKFAQEWRAGLRTQERFLEMEQQRVKLEQSRENHELNGSNVSVSRDDANLEAGRLLGGRVLERGGIALML